jgi:hypothetical protein
MNEPNNTGWVWFQEKISAIMMTLGQKQVFTDYKNDRLQLDIDACNVTVDGLSCVEERVL